MGTQKSLKLPEAELQWFRDAKFGMFIHWGLYAILGRGEWVMFHERLDKDEYAKLADQFDARDYDPQAWAQTAKAAGMKYMVLTTRHHDGFCLFDSKASDYTAAKTAAGRDLVAEYVKACREAGLKVGFYYSPMDWRFPGYFFPTMYRASAEAMKKQCWDQVRELMTNYGRIDLLWFDGGWLAHGGLSFTAEGWRSNQPAEGDNEGAWLWESEKMVAMIRELQPSIVINPRIGWEGDFDTRERTIGEPQNDRAWEACDCLCESWGYIPGAPMRSLRNFIELFVSVAVRGGTLLMNVGPTPGGSIEPRQVERLGQVGDWLKQYGESIYATKGGPFNPQKWGGATCRGNEVFLHIVDWPEEILSLPALPQRILSAKCLTGGECDVRQNNAGITISVPAQHRSPYDTIVKLELDKVC